MFEKFKGLSTLKKTGIVFVLILTIFIFAPLTVKVASAGEIDLYALVMELFAKAETQETKIEGLEVRIAELEAGGEPRGDELGEPADPGDLGGGDSGDGSAPPGGGESLLPSGGGDDPAPDPDPKEPEPEPALPEPPEPEPWPALTEVDYKLTPQRSDSGRMEYRFEGSMLYCDFYRPVPEEMKYNKLTYKNREEETEYAFTESIDLVAAWQNWENNGVKPMLKGQLPYNVIINPQRDGSVMSFDLLNWYGGEIYEGGVRYGAPYDVRFPERQVYTLP